MSSFFSALDRNVYVKGVYYSPVNALTSMMGLGVKYDSKKNKLFVGGGTDGVMMSDIIKPYAGEFEVNPYMELGGIPYKNGYQISITSSINTSFNLQGKYSEITGIIGLEDFDYGDVEVSFIGDGNILKTMRFATGDLPEKIGLSVKNVQKLSIDIKPSNSNYWGNSYVDFVNVKIK